MIVVKANDSQIASSRMYRYLKPRRHLSTFEGIELQISLCILEIYTKIKRLTAQRLKFFDIELHTL